MTRHRSHGWPSKYVSRASASVGALFAVASAAMVISVTKVCSVEEFIEATRKDSEEWNVAWFRGEPGNVETPLIPTLYRRAHNENRLLQLFRMKAPIFRLTLAPTATAQQINGYFLPNT